MNTSRLQLIIEDLIKLAEDNPTILSMLGELVEEISTTYNAPSNWKDIGEELEMIYREHENTDIYECMELEGYKL